MADTRDLGHLPMVVDAHGATIRDCIEAIQRGGASIALVVDSSGSLSGVVTDGDVRRAWLSGVGIDDPVGPLVQRAPMTVSPEISRATVIELMQARGLSQVPVVDQDGILKGLHTMRALLGHETRPNAAVVLAGGRGTRLYPLTKEVPKPMLPVAGRPILERIVTHLIGYGIVRIYLAVGYKSETISDYFGDGESLGCSIKYIREDPKNPLGTGGPLSALDISEDLRGYPLLVLNGDLVTQFNVADLLAQHSASGAIATVGVSTYGHEVPFGVLQVNADGYVQEVVEKPIKVETVNAGIYVLAPEVISRIPSGTNTPMTGVLNDCLSRGEPVAAWNCGPDWIDIGQPQDLMRARRGR